MVDADGDLLLNVGAKLGVKPWSFRVCSAALRRASAVWKSMLFGSWIDAKPAEGDWTVDFPEDNPESFNVLLAILHGKFLAVPSVVSLDCLCAILVLADKYDLIHLLRPISTGGWQPSRTQTLRRATRPGSHYSVSLEAITSGGFMQRGTWL